MNKTEKLLAARKKLKEFQQHKLHNNHQYSEGQTKENQEHNAESRLQNNQAEMPTMSPILPLINTSLLETSTVNESVNHHVNEESPNFQQAIGQLNMANSKSELANFDTITDSHHHQQQQQPDDDLFQQNGSTENDSSLQDSPSLHKQHLLQMATDVVNALKENDKDGELRPIHSDLDYRNQFLTTCLEEQKRLVNHLHIQVSQYSARVSSLEALLSTKDAEFEAKLLREINPLKEQLKVHAQTTGILVAEKAELTSAIAQYQRVAHEKSEEVEELCGKLNNSHSQISDLERQLMNHKYSMEEMQKNYNQLQGDYAHLDKKFSELKKDKEEQQLESAELRQDLNLKNIELSDLHREFNENKNLLSLAELKIQQLTNTPNGMQSLEGQHQAQMVLEQQVAQLRDTLKSLNTDKEETSKHYENYVKQLDARYEKTAQELETAKRNISEYEEREESFIQRLSLMEQQYQREKQRAEALLPLQAHQEKIQHLTKSMDALVLEQESLQLIIQEKETEIESLRQEIHQLRDIQDQSVESLRLVSALESEQLGASRAVSQNQELKSQLNEMHDAFVTLSNSKLDLTEQLQGERTIGRKLNAELNKMDAERDQLKEQLKHKDTIIEELQKDKLHVAQITDQMQHYQAQSSQTRTLQDELQTTLSILESIKSENEGLRERCNLLESSSQNLYPQNNHVENLLVEKKDLEIQTENEGSVLSEAFIKLEARFKETMEKVAELTDEKQRLDHLVLQLQGETETIGEYITLYQKQRSILHKKAQEKEQTFQQLLEQRNQQQVQLHQLKVLVAELLKSQTSQVNQSTLQTTIEPQAPDQINVEHRSEQLKLDINPKNETTAKILDLLTEIKDCKDTCSLEPNFHPCLWCSGKLITV